MTRHFVVVDLGFGDAGKGTVVDWLCSVRPVGAVIRFNGGSQAGHNVVTPDGRHHTFSQVGSGAFHPGVRTHLSRFTLVDPIALAREVEHLERLGVPDVWEWISMDPRCLLITPWHAAECQRREVERGADRHGSVGVGVGVAVEYGLDHPSSAPRIGDVIGGCSGELPWKINVMRFWLGGWDVSSSHSQYADAVAEVMSRVRLWHDEDALPALTKQDCVLEGAQGVLLDEWWGFHPYTTWSTCTPSNALTLLYEAGVSADDVERIGVLRTHAVRHGPGPMPTEDSGLAFPEPHNSTDQWRGAVRFGHFDAVASRYAIAVCGGVDWVALTHLDQVSGVALCPEYAESRFCTRDIPVGLDRDLVDRQKLTRSLMSARPAYLELVSDWPQAVSTALGVPVGLVSTGPTSADKRVLSRSIK